MADVLTLLPPNAGAEERALEQATARIGAVPVPLRSLWNPNTCPLDLLPWLAWALSVDSWSPDWSEAIKRNRIRAAIAIQRKKGTIGSIRTAVSVIGGAVSITEWWQKTPRGTPHTFEVTLQLGQKDGAPAPGALIDDVIAEIRRAKPVRSHFEFVLGVDVSVREGVIGVSRPAVYTRLSATA